jgi:SAM-dependent methyltransferase
VLGDDVIWLRLLFAVVGLAVILYWLFITTEGAYLGSGVVAKLYDWSAKSYDRIKSEDPIDEAEYLAAPLLEKMEVASAPLLLDVATGTGRLPLALLRQVDFCGHIVGLDLAAKMLEQAQCRLVWYRGRFDLVRQNALTLPFRDENFDVVTCLEALEFMPDPRRVVSEMVRVLKPGGLLLVTNRVGWESHLFPGRHCSRGRLEALLTTFPLRDIQANRWQVYYDQVWARKEG